MHHYSINNDIKSHREKADGVLSLAGGPFATTSPIVAGLYL